MQELFAINRVNIILPLRKWIAIYLRLLSKVPKTYSTPKMLFLQKHNYFQISHKHDQMQTLLLMKTVTHLLKLTALRSWVVLSRRSCVSKTHCLQVITEPSYFPEQKHISFAPHRWQ